MSPLKLEDSESLKDTEVVAVTGVVAVANVGTGTHVQSWHLKFDAKGTIRYIGNYKQCCERFSEICAQFFRQQF